MDQFLNCVNNILENRVEDVNGTENTHEEKIELSSMTSLLNEAGVSIHVVGEEEISKTLEEMSAKQKKQVPGLGAMISCGSGLLFYYLWLEMFLGMDNMILEMILTLIFSDIVFGIYAYFRVQSSRKVMKHFFDEFHFDTEQKILKENYKILQRVHIPLPNAKMESYQNLCNILGKYHFSFPEDITDIRSQINYLKQRLEDGVFEIRQDEVCVLCPHKKKEQ